MKKVITVLIIIGILLAFSVSSFAAIGFDAEKIYESVFVISAGRSIGSGFAIGENIIITNYHVVENANNVFIETYEGKKIPAEIYDSNSKLDIAILIVENCRLTPLKIGNEETAKIGDDIYTIGAPNSMAYTLTKGVISAKGRVILGQKYIQIDAAINTGNSGGPLLNDSGEVLGINTLKLSDAEGIGLSIPISIAVDYIKSSGVLFDSDNVASVTVPESSFAEQESVQNETVPSSEKPIKDVPVIENDEKNGTFFYVNLGIVAALVLLAVITILVVYKKNSGKYIIQNDPSERTDFEIEIEE